MNHLILLQFLSFLFISIHGTTKKPSSREKKKIPLWYILAISTIVVLLLVLVLILIYLSCRRQRLKRAQRQLERQRKDFEMFPVAYPMNTWDTVRTVGAPSEFDEYPGENNDVKTII